MNTAMLLSLPTALVAMGEYMATGGEVAPCGEEKKEEATAGKRRAGSARRHGTRSSEAHREAKYCRVL